MVEELKPNMEKHEVHKLGEQCRTVHSSIGFYTLMDLFGFGFLSTGC